MQKHPKNRRKIGRKQTSDKKSSARGTRRRRQNGSTPGNALPTKLSAGRRPEEDVGFVSLLLERMSVEQLDGLKQRSHPAGRRAYRLQRWQLLVGILFHYSLRSAGTLGEHVGRLFNIQMAESSLSQRRQAVPFEVFRELLQRMLRPIEKMEKQEQACYRGLRLVALDGTRFSLPNNASVENSSRKGSNQYGRIAFAKLQCTVLLELMMHNPLGAALGVENQSEWNLAQSVIQSVPSRSLLLGDRLYGNAAFVAKLQETFEGKKSHFLLRVKEATKARRIKKLKDYSQLVQADSLVRGDRHHVATTVTVREIVATIARRGYAPVKIRLWTSLLDPLEAPAEELVRLYAQRWEHELYFRELKSSIGINDLLRSQTIETAGQEVAAMIIGSSIIAHQRAKLPAGEVLQHRVSLIKVWETLEPLWLTLLLGADLLTEDQKQQLSDRFYRLAATCKMAKKRCRACPRAMRQPQRQFPRKRNQPSSDSPLSFTLRLQ